ncbi:hypothetical protein [Puia dinghuensis]|uniref:Uncharacterized protein n=1 Tax=Puia dinghuensis TaxID=1792502 RepID=A0A8J2XSS7_9BACT|nr:hypothetical protein [Puia dinghuensis]GGA98250.1 hypothetical protein GCM10011511_21950 [Puia dinghuensis]
MLQNRVDPLGNIIRTPARGHWMGNRGVLHNPQQEIVRPWKLKAWITCVLVFKGRRRAVMAPDRWTELFFFDEATAFAAGHRPCFECRREDALRFKRCWLKGNPEYGFDERTSMQEIDAVLHRERVSADGQKVMYDAYFGALPDGSFILWKGEPHLVYDGLVYRWSPEGYAAGEPMPGSDSNEIRRIRDTVSVLTPRSVVKAFRAGYVVGVGLVRS